MALTALEREQLTSMLASHTVHELLEAAADICECQNWEMNQKLHSDMCNGEAVINGVQSAMSRWYWRASEAYRAMQPRPTPPVAPDFTFRAAIPQQMNLILQ